MNSKNNHNVIYKLGNFIRLSESRIGQIDGIFTHQLSHKNYAFVVVTLAEGEFGERGVRTVDMEEDSDDVDPILQAQVFRMSDCRMIVGLPRVGSQRIWVTEAIEDGEMWLHDWDIWFM